MKCGLDVALAELILLFNISSSLATLSIYAKTYMFAKLFIPTRTSPPEADKPVEAKRKSRFIGELAIEY
jgi:hypothetical protein